MLKSICTQNFGEISQSTVELLLPVSENRCQPYWNSSSCSQFSHINLFGMMPSILSLSFVDMHPSRPKLLAFNQKCNMGRYRWSKEAQKILYKSVE